MDRFDSPWNLRPGVQVFSILLMAVCYGRSKRPDAFAIEHIAKQVLALRRRLWGYAGADEAP
jgi:hypothetical protein